MSISTRADDIAVLEILDRRDHDGIGMSDIAREMGVSRNTVIGRCHRVDVAADPDRVCEGTMLRRWWA